MKFRIGRVGPGFLLPLSLAGFFLFLLPVIIPPVITSPVITQSLSAQTGPKDRGPLREPALIYIKPGATLKSISAALQEEGIIANATVFNWYARLSGQGNKLKAGEYEFPARASLSEVVEILTRGVSIDRKLTFPEGMTTDEILAQIAAVEGLTGDVPDAVREGSLFPNTYYYSRNDTRASLVERMKAAMTKESQRLWAGRDADLPVKTLEEAIILASIVEKETARRDEYPVVASVYLNRLRINKKLQADPTVIYAIGRDRKKSGQGKLDRKLLIKDLKYKSPFNTYVNKGLPPTPICNPGLGALDGVLRPANTPYLYFVADGSGGHVFAQTYQEHLKNVKEWRAFNANN